MHPLRSLSFWIRLVDFRYKSPRLRQNFIFFRYKFQDFVSIYPCVESQDLVSNSERKSSSTVHDPSTRWAGSPFWSSHNFFWGLLHLWWIRLGESPAHGKDCRFPRQRVASVLKGDGGGTCVLHICSWGFERPVVWKERATFEQWVFLLLNSNTVV